MPDLSLSRCGHWRWEKVMGEGWSGLRGQKFAAWAKEIKQKALKISGGAGVLSS